jgi:hypothetical protein
VTLSAREVTYRINLAPLPRRGRCKVKIHWTDVRRGYIFTHDQLIDENWTPGDGEGYADAPKARMVVTRATLHTVWYKPIGRHGRAACAMDRGEFESRFGR